MAKATAKKSENEYDERKETLVVEEKTEWPAGVTLSEAERLRVAGALHRDPKSAAKMAYVRCPTGFVRVITATPEELTRLNAVTGR